jgi:uncharacterized protein involved in exopolysaccharide biosynthesis
VTTPAVQTANESVEVGSLDLLEMLIALAQRWKLLVLGSLLAGAAAWGATYLIAPTFTAQTAFLPPQQPQSAAAAMLSNLGGLAGAAVGARTPADQYAALLQSANVEDRIVDHFKLLEAYDVKFRADARKQLRENVRISVGKRDGLITVEVDDRVPARAAEMANRYVDELKRVTSQLALTEAQQRRVFFEAQLKQTRDKLAQAQEALQASGFGAGSLRAEPRAAADSYAKLKAEVTATEVRLQTLRRGLTDSTPEVQQQLTLLSSLRSQLAKVEASDLPAQGPDYISRYRDFKYQETLFEVFSRQYEMARLDESKDSGLIQVVDTATTPEKKSKPRRAVIAGVATLFAGLLMALWLSVSHAMRLAAADGSSAPRLRQPNSALRR